jgi:hypothetical protein
MIDGQRMTHQVQFGMQHCFWYAPPKERAYLDKSIVSAYQPFQSLGSNGLIVSKHVFAGSSFYCAIAQEPVPSADLPQHWPNTWRLLGQDSIVPSDTEVAIQAFLLATPQGYLFRLALNEQQPDVLLLLDAPTQDSAKAVSFFQNRDAWAARLIP